MHVRKISILVALAVATAVCVSSALAKEQRFLVITNHTPESCLTEIDKVNARGEKMLAMFDWGCMYGDHTGYAIIEAKDEAAARAMLPAGLSQVRLIKVGKFTREQIRAFHEKMMQK
jgi:hypothetical protein